MRFPQFKFILIFFLAAGGYTTAQIPATYVNDYLDKARKMAESPRLIPPFDDSVGVSLLFAADSMAIANNDQEGRAAVNEQLGNCYYSKDPDKSIQYFSLASSLYAVLNNKRHLAWCEQNLAFAFCEKKKDIPSAIIAVEKSIAARREVKDTINEANMQKYAAMLYGKVHKYAAGKEHAAIAIKLYASKNVGYGVAVSNFDLASVYLEEKKQDSALIFLKTARSFWIGANDTFRIFGIDLKMIRAYTATGNKAEAGAIFKECREMLRSPKIHYLEELEYYDVVSNYYSLTKDNNLSEEYREKYTAFREKLQKEGRDVD